MNRSPFSSAKLLRGANKATRQTPSVECALRRVISSFLVLALVAACSTASCMEPTDFTFTARAPASSVAARITAKVEIKSNVEKGIYAVTFRQRDVADNSMPREFSRQGAVRLRPGRTAHGVVSLTLSSAEKQAVALDALILDDAGRLVAKESTFLYFKLANGRFVLTTYPDQYIPPKLSAPIAGAVYELSASKARQEMAVRSVDIIGFGTTPPRERIADLRPFLEKLSSVLPKETAEFRKHLSIEQQFAGNAPRSYVTLGGDAPSFSVSGRFFFIGVDNAWHPAVNWTVRMSWRDSDGDDHILAYADVQADGSWATLFSALGYSGENLLVQYAPTNRFAKMVDKEDREFWWSSTRASGILASTAQGDEAADTSAAGWLMGMGDAFQSAMVFWNRFYLAGVDAARDDPIRMYFPNTWNMCGGTFLWSCSSQDDAQLWLIAAHFDAFTVQHELGHQLNSKFWSDGLGPGGSHSTLNCVDPLVALTEGFADAIPYWINDNLDSAAPMGRWGDIETRGGCVGDWNEMHVASTLWDLMDSNADGLDHVTSLPAYAPLLVYLMTGRKDSFRFYRQDIRAAFPPAEGAAIDDVFRQNLIDIVP